MKLTYYGHSCFSVETGGKVLLFDPFIRPNELVSGIDFSAIKADYILVSHGHSDHTADLVDLALQTNALVISSFEITEWAAGQGVKRYHPMNTGGKWDFGDFKVKTVVAQHSSSFGDGTYAGNPMGFIIYTGEGNFYYSGDTALTFDMQLIPGWAKLNFAILPIGDNFTMDTRDAVKCMKMIDCSVAVGVHYDTFGYIKIDHDKAKKDFEDAGCSLLLPAIGETINMGDEIKTLESIRIPFWRKI